MKWSSVVPHRYGPRDFRKICRLPDAVGKKDEDSLNFPRDVSTRFGRRLRQLRCEKGMTQAYMARRFGIDRSFISDVERGRKSMSLVMLEILAIGLEITLSDLLADL